MRILDKRELDEIVTEELNSYESYLLQSVNDNSEFKYLEHIAEKYSLDKNVVIDKNLDIFNWYMKNNVDEYQSKVMSLYLTHEQVMRECIK